MALTGEILLETKRAGSANDAKQITRTPKFKKKIKNGSISMGTKET